MPARPISDETLHLIDAVRTALSHRSDVQERPLFGTHAFFVDGKMCIAVKGDELLVRLPPTRHGEIQEMQNTRELSPGGGMQGYFWVEPGGYATRAQWRFWVDEALAYNPRAKATPPRKKASPPAGKRTGLSAPAARTTGRTRPANEAQAAKPAAKKRTTAKAASARKHSIFEADD